MQRRAFYPSPLPSQQPVRLRERQFRPKKKSLATAQPRGSRGNRALGARVAFRVAVDSGHDSRGDGAAPAVAVVPPAPSPSPDLNDRCRALPATSALWSSVSPPNPTLDCAPLKAPALFLRRLWPRWTRCRWRRPGSGARARDGASPRGTAPPPLIYLLF